MIEIGQPVIPSLVVTDVESAVKFADEIGYPVIIRPAFTLGGTGGGIVDNEEELQEITSNGLELSPITQVLVEKCISGWKEIEFEVMRDSDGNVITVCSMENFDPVGVHTGDSIVIAPTVTLADKEYQMLRSAALNIISALKVEGGCNCQFALNPETFEYAVIEVNPRVSRSSALASKATGYPIAKVAAKIAIGYTLNEIKNAVTGTTYACFEPALDYVVVKFPKWPFDKFVYAKRTLGTQMKATGEVMAIAPTFEQAIMKAVRGAEISHDTLNDKEFAELSNASVYDRLSVCDDRRIFCVYEALKRGITVEQIHNITLIDEWFLEKLKILLPLKTNSRTASLRRISMFVPRTRDSLTEQLKKSQAGRLKIRLFLFIKWLIPAPQNLRLKLLTSIQHLIRKMKLRNSSKSRRAIRKQLSYSVRVLSESVRVSNLTMRLFTAYGRSKRQATMLLS